MATSPSAPVAVLDANVLYPQFLRDVSLRLAAAELFTPRWSDRIQKEWMRNLARNRPDTPPARLERLRTLMEEAFPEARVKGYRARESDTDLRDWMCISRRHGHRPEPQPQSAT